MRRRILVDVRCPQHGVKESYARPGEHSCPVCHVSLDRAWTSRYAPRVKVPQDYITPVYNESAGRHFTSDKQMSDWAEENGKQMVKGDSQEVRDMADRAEQAADENARALGARNYDGLYEENAVRESHGLKHWGRDA